MDVLEPGGAAIGYTWTQSSSPYRDTGVPGRSFDPIYLYEGDYAYLHSSRLGLKASTGVWRFDAFLTQRMEGYTRDSSPEGNTAPPREPGFDAGISARVKTAWGTPYLELRRDVSHRSGGNEARLGWWGFTWTRDRLHVRPHVALAYRSARLNQYYYDADEGVDVEAGLYADYFLAGNWHLVGSLTWIRHSDAIASSMLVDQRHETAAMLGIMYDFTRNIRTWQPQPKPLIVRVLYGHSSDCDVGRIVQSKCTSRHTVDDTDIWGIEVGRPLVRQPNGRPVEIAAFLGLQRHLERGYQSDFWEYKAYLKAYFWGFPWDRWLRTRFGIGTGLSYAEQIPIMEERDQARSDHGSWKLLNYLDPSIDVRLHDLVPTPPLRDTWLGVGVSHRSGMFAWSRLLGWVDGGSNYIYVYLESNF